MNNLMIIETTTENKGGREKKMEISESAITNLPPCATIFSHKIYSAFISHTL